MSIFKAITKLVFSPVRAIAEVVKDVSGENDEASQGLSILTGGVSSVVKGLAKSIKEASDEVFEDDNEKSK